jgi:hypothetical protein
LHTFRPSSDSAFTQTVRNHLKKVMVVSKRQGGWFALERREKSILYLSLKLNVRFASLDLLRALASILKKLEQHGETLHAWLQRGSKLAWAFSEFAVSCGNKGAKTWRNDLNYALYLGRVMSSNKRGLFAT